VIKNISAKHEIFLRNLILLSELRKKIISYVIKVTCFIIKVFSKVCFFSPSSKCITTMKAWTSNGHYHLSHLHCCCRGHGVPRPSSVENWDHAVEVVVGDVVVVVEADCTNDVHLQQSVVSVVLRPADVDDWKSDATYLAVMEEEGSCKQKKR